MWWIIVIFLLLSISLLVLRPFAIGKLESRSDPLTSYAEAVLYVRAMQEEDNQDSARDVCITKFLDHGEQTEHVIVLLHGFTTCPEQFHELGRLYFEDGYNVLIPRFPYHGLSDRMTDALINLDAEKLAAFGDRVIDIAHGLGKKVSVMGISASGTLICWLAQNRSDIDFAFAIAPLFGLAFVPPAFTRLFERIALLLPNFYMWWDPRTKAENPFSIYYAYPGYPSRALFEIMRLGMITRAQAEKSAPAAKNVLILVNEAEPAVSNAEIAKLVRLWKRRGATNVSESYFEKEMKLPHD